MGRVVVDGDSPRADDLETIALDDERRVVVGQSQGRVSNGTASSHPMSNAHESVMSGSYARTSLMSARRFSSGSRKNAIQSSWSGIRAIRWGFASKATPRAVKVSNAAWRSGTL